ncbi:MAG: oligosaccharide flippase family protein [Methanomicrobiaceae archaeon]|nr:oligosaccharide flippase family protein [Methanomicrobiaceae archaeon]
MSRFVKNVLKLVSGSVIAQIIGILLVPIITRLYAPDDFGISQLFLSIVSIAAVFSCLSYPQAIMLPEKDEDAAHLLVLSFALLAVFCILMAIIALVAAEPVGELLNAPAISSYLVLVPLAIFLSAGSVVVNFWLSRRQNFGKIAISRVSGSISGKVVQIAMGATPSPLGLIIGSMANNLIADLAMLKTLAADAALFARTTSAGMRQVAVRYKKFPLISTWSSTAAVISGQLPPFLLIFYFSPAVVGYYALATQIVHIPMNLIGGAISQVFYQKACHDRNTTGSIRRVVQEMNLRLISIGAFPVVVLMVAGGDLFGFFLGGDWYTAGVYATILAPWMFVAFISVPLQSVFSVLERQGTNLFFNGAILASRFAVLIAGGLSGDPVIALVLFSATGVLFWGGMNLYTLRIADVPYRDALLGVLTHVGLACCVLVPLILAGWAGYDVPVLIVCIAAAGIPYYGWVLSRDMYLKTALTGVLRGFWFFHRR